MAVELKECPMCGKQPRVIRTLVQTYFVACFDHLETKGCFTEAEAIALWNAGQYEQPQPPTTGRAPRLSSPAS